MELDITKLQSVLNAIDENIFFKDTEGRYVMATHICQMLSDGKPDSSIYGKTDREVQPDKKLGEKFYREDMEIVRTGQPVKYIQEMTFPQGTFFYEIQKNPVMDKNGEILGISGIVKDVTESTRLYKKMEKYSVTDEMTQAYNRTYYESGKYKEDLQYPVAVVMIDINHLKYYNDHFGHKEGDILIKTIVNNIQSHLRDDDRLIRFGGDEFLLLLQACDSAQGEKIVHRIRQVEGKIQLQDIPVGAAYGMAEAKSPEDLETAISQADQAMYADKRKAKVERLVTSEL